MGENRPNAQVPAQITHISSLRCVATQRTVVGHHISHVWKLGPDGIPRGTTHGMWKRGKITHFTPMGRPLRDHQIAVKTHYRRNQQWYNLMLTSSERSIGTGEVDLDI